MSVQPSSPRGDRQAWDDWGRIDPLWAVLTEPDAQGGRWDLEPFFESGQTVVDTLLAEARNLGIPSRYVYGLDFGCGVGRLSRALTHHLKNVTGIDISPSMIEKANELNSDIADCSFVVSGADELRIFGDGEFDVVLSLLVLQHVPSVAGIEDYLRELVRVLAPDGALIFQLPSFVPTAPPTNSLRSRLRPRSRAFGLLLRLGVSKSWMYRRLGWRPAMPMAGIPAPRVADVVRSAGGRVLAIRDGGTDLGGVESQLYFVSTGPDHYAEQEPPASS